MCVIALVRCYLNTKIRFIVSGEGVIHGRTIARTRGTESIWPGANVQLEVTSNLLIQGNIPVIINKYQP